MSEKVICPECGKETDNYCSFSHWCEDCQEMCRKWVEENE
jgi:hypothetical protein